MEIWAQAVLALATLAAVVLFALAGRLPGRDRGARGIPPEAFLAGLLLLGLVQILPLPPGLHRILSPEAARWLDRGLPPEDAGRWRMLSLYPLATRVEILRFATLGMVYFLFARGLSRGSEARGALAAFAALGTAAAAAALVDPATGGAALGWYPRETRFEGRLAGVLVNPNHFAGMMDMTALAALGLFFARSARDPGREAGGLGSALARGLRTGTNRPAAVALAIAMVVTTAALLLTGSRLGVFAFVAGLATFAVLVSRSPEPGRALAGLAAVAAVLLAINVAVALDPLRERWTLFSGGGAAGGRIRVLGAVAAMGGRFTVAGSGLGTFEHLFPAFQPPDVGGTWDRAHNDFLQLFCDGGLPAILLAVGFAAAWVRPVARAAVSGPGPRRGVAAGVLAAAAALAVHSLGDFCLQIPVNAYLLAALLGIGTDAALRPPSGRDRP